MYSKGPETQCRKDMCTLIFIEILSNGQKSGDNPLGKKKLWHVYTKEYYFAIRIDESCYLLPCKLIIKNSIEYHD